MVNRDAEVKAATKMELKGQETDCSLDLGGQVQKHRRA